MCEYVASSQVPRTKKEPKKTFRIDFSGPVVEAEFLPGKVLCMHRCIHSCAQCMCFMYAGQHPALQGSCSKDDSRADYAAPR